MKSLQKRHKGLSAEMLNVEKPTDPNHPGSEIYAYDVKEIKTNLLGRSVEVYLPVAKDATPSKRFPVIVFGHGQAITSSGYNLTFRHLARRGVAVVFPMYDKGFFDQEWRRMAQDFNLLTQETLKVYGDQLDNSQVIYSGHSKGAYVALMAAGAPSLKTSSFALNSVVLFAPAGFESEYLKNMDPNLPLSIIWGENDSVIKFSLQKDIFDKSQAKYKQLIKVKSYTQPALSADHFFILNEPTFLGGRQGLSSFHYHGVWKWLLGAVWDVEKGESAKNEFLYGEESLKSGQSGVVHDVERSW
jgi:dienelactone hydrolase